MRRGQSAWRALPRWKARLQVISAASHQRRRGHPAIDQYHRLKAVIYFGDDVTDTDTFRMLRAVRAEGHCMTLPVGVLYADSPVRLLKSADVVVDGPACAKAFIEHIVDKWPGSVLARATWHCLLQNPGAFGEQVSRSCAWTAVHCQEP